MGCILGNRIAAYYKFTRRVCIGLSISKLVDQNAVNIFHGHHDDSTVVVVHAVDFVDEGVSHGRDPLYEYTFANDQYTRLILGFDFAAYGLGIIDLSIHGVF